MNAINAVSLEDYVAGVVSRESPSSWPLEALKAQAVAARTYAVTTSKAGAGFDQYADTRSQVYGGVAAETASTNQAVAATRGQVVTYEGEPVVTFFFSTSGGRTENVENTNLGTAPKPWLKSVADPYDGVSPKHRWGPIKLTLRAGRRASSSGLVKGRFKGIKVVRRGRSPRIVSADIVGTGGRTRVSRRHAARPPRAARHVGVLHLDRHAQGAADRRSRHRRHDTAAAVRGHRRPAAARVDRRQRGPGPRRRRGADPAPLGRPLADRRLHGRALRRQLPRRGCRAPASTALCSPATPGRPSACGSRSRTAALPATPCRPAPATPRRRPASRRPRARTSA